MTLVRRGEGGEQTVSESLVSEKLPEGLTSDGSEGRGGRQRQGSISS